MTPSLPPSYRAAFRTELRRAFSPPYEAPIVVVVNGLLMTGAWFLLPLPLQDMLFRVHGELAFPMVLVAWMFSDVPATNVLGSDAERSLAALDRPPDSTRRARGRPDHVRRGGPATAAPHPPAPPPPAPGPGPGCPTAPRTPPRRPGPAHRRAAPERETPDAAPGSPRPPNGTGTRCAPVRAARDPRPTQTSGYASRAESMMYFVSSRDDLSPLAGCCGICGSSPTRLWCLSSRRPAFGGIVTSCGFC